MAREADDPLTVGPIRAGAVIRLALNPRVEKLQRIAKDAPRLARFLGERAEQLGGLPAQMTIAHAVKVSLGRSHFLPRLWPLDGQITSMRAATLT